MKQNLHLKEDNRVHKYSVKINLGIGHCKMYSYDSEKIKAKLDLTQRNPLGSTDYPIIPTPKIIWLWLNSAVSRLEVCGVGAQCYSSCLKVTVIGNGDIQYAHISL